VAHGNFAEPYDYSPALDEDAGILYTNYRYGFSVYDVESGKKLRDVHFDGFCEDYIVGCITMQPIVTFTHVIVGVLNTKFCGIVIVDKETWEIVWQHT